MQWLEDILSSGGDCGEIAEKISELYTEKAEYERLMLENEQLMASALESKINSFNPINLDDVKLILQNVDIDEIDTKLTELKQQKSYLFQKENLAGITPFVGEPVATAISKESFAAMGYKERMELYSSDPQLYSNLCS